MIEKLIKQKTPFAIVKSYDYVLNIPKKVKVYELLLFDNNTGNVISYNLDNKDLKDFTVNISKLNLKHNTEDGAVYEFMNFKEHYNLRKGKKVKRVKQQKI